MKNLTWQNPEQLFVAQVLINKVKSKCCGIKDIKDGATTGIATINNLKEEFSLLSSVALLKLGDEIVNYYLKAVLNTQSLYNSIRSNMGGAAITRLTLVKIKAIRIPLPPLSLQQLFAQRIEQIEREKSEVQKSIQDLETLLASRMQYWFE